MFRFLVSLFALPLVAQTQWALPPPPARALVPDPMTLQVLRKPLTVAQPRIVLKSPGWNIKTSEPYARPCAVPLVNALRFRTPDPPMPKYTPPGPFRMREFPLPAPSCEDKERK